MALSAGCAAFDPTFMGQTVTGFSGLGIHYGIVNAPLDIGDIVTLKVRNDGGVNARLYIAARGSSSGEVIATVLPGQTGDLSYTVDADSAQNGVYFGVETVLATNQFTVLSATCTGLPVVTPPANNANASDSSATVAIVQQQSTFLQSRASTLMANTPAAQRRIARLNGTPTTGSVGGESILNYVESLAKTGSMPVSGSLASPRPGVR